MGYSAPDSAECRASAFRSASCLEKRRYPHDSRKRPGPHPPDSRRYNLFTTFRNRSTGQFGGLLHRRNDRQRYRRPHPDHHNSECYSAAFTGKQPCRQTPGPKRPSPHKREWLDTTSTRICKYSAANHPDRSSKVYSRRAASAHSHTIVMKLS